MNPGSIISSWWKSLSITVKFSYAFWLLLIAMFLLATGSFAVLNQVAQRTEAAILASIEMERLILEMDRGFERARVLQRDFFRLYPIRGYSQARDTFAREAIVQIGGVIKLSSRLRELLAGLEVSESLTKSEVNLDRYLTASERYRDAFMESVELLTELSSDETGLQVQLNRSAETLENSLYGTGSHELLDMYREMRIHEKNYAITQTRSCLQTTLKTATLLLQKVQKDPVKNAAYNPALAANITRYCALAERIGQVNAAIEEKMYESDVQAASVDPVSKELILLAEKEVTRARDKLHRARTFAFMLLFSILFMGTAFTFVVVHFWNKGVTQPIVRLTRIAGEIHYGNLDARAPIEGGDELGQLAQTLNAMAHQIKSRLAEMKGLNENLRASETKYRGLFEDSHDIIAVATPEGRIVDVNKTGVAMLGYGFEELLTRNVRDLFLDIEDWVLFIQELEREDVVENFEAKIRHSENRHMDALINATIQKGPDQTVTGFQVVFHNITERKRAQMALAESRNYLDKIINSVADPIFVKDRQHRWVMVNDAFCSVLGYHREELLGKIDHDLFPKKEADDSQSGDEAVFISGRENVNEEKFTDSKGSVHTFVTKKTLYRDENGSEYIVGVIRDMTESRRLEQQLWQAVKMEAVGTLAGGVAHDFNNLMTAVIGYCDLLLMRLEKGSVLRKDVEQIRRAGNKAATLTGQLLAFSRKQMLKPKILDLNFLLSDMIKMLCRVIGEDIDLVTVPSSDLGTIFADPNLLEQVIMNLVVNARDAMPNGGKLILRTENQYLDQGYCEKHVEAKPGYHVMLSVSDTGVGMSEQVLSHIFEPFYTTKEKGKGTGLGLATAYGIVRQSGGHILVKSEPGRGTSFQLLFPGAVEELDGQSRKEGPPCAPRGGTETILLVEDEEVVRDLASRSLRMYGYTVIEAERGEEALKLFETNGAKVRLLITDVVMPGINGCELAKTLVEHRPGLKVLYISGYTGNAVEQHGLLKKGAAFLQKPFSPEILASSVRDVLDSISTV